MAAGGQRVIVITGASSGIGRALALRLAAPGVRLWLVARSGERLEEVAAAVRGQGGEARPVRLDLRDGAAAAAFLDGELAGEERLDEFYLVAAVSLFGEVKDLLMEDWRAIYETNLLSPVQWIAALYPRLVRQGGGRLVVFASLAAYAGYPTSVPYVTMKGGLLGMFRSLTHEARAGGVDLHLVSPGFVDTGIYRSAIYRKTDCDTTLRQVRRMGFRMIPADRAAELTLRAIARGRREIVFPGYARAMAWASRRIPWLQRVVHRMWMENFLRGASS
jgi:short-subunit dehydrogenase